MSINDGSSSGVDVRGIEILADLDAALQRFAVRSADALAEFRALYERNRKRLEQRAEDADREVRRRVADLQNADDDDIDYCQRRLDDAREARADIRSWQKRVEEEYETFRRDAARFDATLDGTVKEGRGVLQSKIALLKEYKAIQLDAVSTGSLSLPSSESTASQDAVSIDASQDASHPSELRGFPLPKGFRWIPLAEINLKEELKDVQDAIDYRKVDKETMRVGMIRLRSEILPRLSSERESAGADFFFEADRAASQSYENGLQRIYEVFFGESHIHLERGGTAGQLDITNGRHRIKLAQELGWDAVPATVENGRE